MLTILYHLSFIAVLLSAVSWFWLRERNVSASFVGKSFWLSLLMHLVMTLLGDWGLIFKLFFMFPLDVAIFVAVILLFNHFVTKSKLLFSLVGIVLLVIKIFTFDLAHNAYQTYWEGKNTTVTANTLTNVAKQGELLVDLRTPANLDALVAFSAEYDIGFAKAFPNLRHDEYSELDDY